MPGVSTTEPIDVVRRFCAAFAAGDLDDIIEFFTDDAVYHNIPLDPVVGKDAIRVTLAGIMGGFDTIEFRLEHIAAAGDVVLTERVDILHGPNKTVSLPVMGAFEIVDDKISGWRDYFDMRQFTKQLTG